MSARPGEVTGRVRLSVPAPAVTLVVARLLPRFIEPYPKVEVEVQIENRFVNVVAEGLDAGIRLSEAIERDMVQVRLTEPGRFVVAAAPSYLARRGTPENPQDLLQHDCLCIRASPSAARYAWELERGRKSWRVPVHPGTWTPSSPSAPRRSPGLARQGRPAALGPPRSCRRGRHRGRSGSRHSTPPVGGVRPADASKVWPWNPATAGSLAGPA